MINQDRVLIVSGDQLRSAALRDCLDQAGFGVQIVDSGALALEKISKEKPCLVLLDYELPDLSGLAVIHSIRSDDIVRGVPIIVIDGDTNVQDRLLGYETGADICLSEALPSRVFVGLVRAMLRRVYSQGSIKPNCGPDQYYPSRT